MEREFVSCGCVGKSARMGEGLETNLSKWMNRTVEEEARDQSEITLLAFSRGIYLRLVPHGPQSA